MYIDVGPVVVLCGAEIPDSVMKRDILGCFQNFLEDIEVSRLSMRAKKIASGYIIIHCDHYMHISVKGGRYIIRRFKKCPF